MSYAPPPSSEPPAHEPGRRREFWYGVGVGLFACLVLPFLALSGVDAFGFIGFTVLSPLLVLVAGVVLTIPSTTRRWGTGLLTAFAVSLVVGAGACVVLIASLNTTGA